MAKILIVHAHPEPKSFSSALARTAQQTFEQAGHRVTFSDLYGMGFDPVSDRSNFLTTADPVYFKPQYEEHYASAHQGFAPPLESEMRELEAADLLIFSFPLWWFGVPAILKGWIDRVFAYGRIYGRGRWYEQGVGRGKRAMALITTGGPATMYRQDGLHSALEKLLTPLHHGVFWFNGFTTLRPFVTWGAAHISQGERESELQALRTRLSTVFAEPGVTMTPASEHHERTGIDRIPHHLVSVRQRFDGEIDASVPSKDDLARLREFRRQGVLLRAMIPMGNARLWQMALEFRTPTAAAALALFEELPLSRQCSAECTTIDPSIENSLSPYA